MKTTLTVRLDERQAKAVAAAARRLGKSVSDVVRDALDTALTERAIAARAGHVKGRLRLSRRRSPWRDALRERNWRA